MSVSFEKLLEEFATGSAPAKHSAFRKLIALRQHHKALVDCRFKLGLDSLLLMATDELSKDVDRLLAIATLGRIGSTIRSIRPKIQKDLVAVLEKPFPDISILDDVEDRCYIGQVCAIDPPAWVGGYAARSSVLEESGEQARQAFLSALLKSTADLETALGVLAENLQAWVPDTEEPGNSVSRRLRRILAAFRTAIADTMPESMPNLIEERNAITEMPGLSDQRWTLGRYQTTGI